MIIGIHKKIGSFSDRWISYCEEKNILWKTVDCYSNNIIEDLDDCNALMWHFHQNGIKDILFARQLIYSINTSGKMVFPDFHTAWHFDDKVGQKYLLESIKAPFVPTWIFYDKKEALKWIETCNFPIVFKLRSGAGAQNVRLVHSKKEASGLVRKSFGKGFPSFYWAGNMKERWRLFQKGKLSYLDLLKGIIRIVIPPAYLKNKGFERGYVYFQNFIEGNNHDIRVIVIDNKAFAIKRMVREKDFRASGSGNILYNRNLFDEQTIRLSFEIAEKLKTQCVAFDYVFSGDNPLLVEISYGFTPEGYDPCPGYWDRDLTWHEGTFNPYGWMVDIIVRQINESN